MELRYLRDTDGREIDFVVLKDKKPIFAVECKSGDGQLSKHVLWLCENRPSFAIHNIRERVGFALVSGRSKPQSLYQD